MNGLSAGNSVHRNPAVRRVVVVARVAAVGKVEAVLVVMAAKVAVVLVVREAKAEADVQVASAVRHRVQLPARKPKRRNKTPRQPAHGVCGSG